MSGQSVDSPEGVPPVPQATTCYEVAKERFINRAGAIEHTFAAAHRFATEGRVTVAAILYEEAHEQGAEAYGNLWGELGRCAFIPFIAYRDVNGNFVSSREHAVIKLVAEYLPSMSLVNMN